MARKKTNIYLNEGLAKQEMSIQQVKKAVEEEKENLKLTKSKRKAELKKEKNIVENGTKDQINAFLNKMSDVDKIAFRKALERDVALCNFQAYLKYTEPQYKNYKLSRFLCQLVDYVVNKVENDKKVRLLVSMPPRHTNSCNKRTQSCGTW